LITKIDSKKGPANWHFSLKAMFWFNLYKNNSIWSKTPFFRKLFCVKIFKIIKSVPDGIGKMSVLTKSVIPRTVYYAHYLLGLFFRPHLGLKKSPTIHLARRRRQVVAAKSLICHPG
jgi:hypothetical protein